MRWLWIAIAAAVGFAVVLALVFRGQFLDVLPAAIGNVGNAIVMILLILIAGLFIFWAILWMLFPGFVYFSLDNMEKLLRLIERNTRR